MGNRYGRQRPAIDERYTRTQGLYQHHDIDVKKLRKLILEEKLAPCYSGCDDPALAFDLEECPICFLYYPSLNRSKCCAKGICTECFLQMKSPNSARPTQCPFCKTASYSVEYRGVKTIEEKDMEQIEEQRVIEAQIRMRQQELLDDEAERMKKRQSVTASRMITPLEVEYYDTGGTSHTVQNMMKGNDFLPSQLLNSQLELRNSSRSRQMRDDNFDLDLEDFMLMEAIWFSIQDQNNLGNQGSVGTALAVTPSDQFDRHMTAPSESTTSGRFACAVAALAQQQHRYGESSSVGTSTYDMLQRSDSSFVEDMRTVEGSLAENRNEVSSSIRKGGIREVREYSNDQWSEVAEAGTSYAGSDVTVYNGVDALVPLDGVNTAPGHVPDDFEEQMMLAMAISLSDAQARASGLGATWL